MNYKLWAGLLLALTASVHPAALRAGQNAAKAPSWQQVLQKENKKAVSRGASSVLGTSVTANVRLISAQAQAAKVMENLFTSLLKKQRKSESEIQACKANYQDLQETVHLNKLFKNYVLTAVVPNDFCWISREEKAFLKRFFNNLETPQEARQYKEALLLSFSYQHADMWLVIKPQEKLIIFNYNDPADLKSIKELNGKFRVLSVK